ncbi:MAG: AI-2E family transporter [Alkalispirochaeta sp.]
MSDASDSPKRSVRQLRIPTGVARANTVYLFIIALVSVGTVLRLTGSIFIPFVIAVLLSFVFAPIVSFLVKRHVPRFIAITFVLLIFLAFGFLIALIIYSSFQSLLREFPTYQARFSQLLRDVIVRFDLPPDITSQLEVTRTIGSTLLSFSGNFMSFASGFMVVMIFLLFLLMEKPYTRRKLSMAVRDETTRRLSRVLLHITSQIGRYVAVKLLVSTLTAIVVYVLFRIIGVDFPFVWSVLTFLFNFIPSIGSVAITFISGIFAMVQFLPEWNPIIVAFSGMALTQFVIGNVLDPKLIGDRLNLSPVIILLSLLLWGWLWGTAGLFLAVPLTVAIKIVFENVPGMEAFGILMGTGNFKPPRRQRPPEEAQPSE